MGVVIWDGMERLPDDDVILALDTAVSDGLRVISTSRKSPPQLHKMAIRDLALESMSERDTEMLLKKIGIDGPQATQLHQALQGHPLTLSLVSSGMRSGHFTVEEVLRMLLSREE